MNTNMTYTCTCECACACGRRLICLQVRRLSVTAEAPQASGKPAAPWTLMFSATWTARTAKLAKAMLAPGAVHVTVGGEQTAAAASVTQRVEVLKAKGAPRMKRLCELLRESLGSAAPPAVEGDDDEDDEGDEGDDEGDEEEGGEEEAGAGDGADDETAAVAGAAAEIAAAGAAAAAAGAAAGAGAAELPQV